MNFVIHMASLVAYMLAMYSASIVDKVDYGLSFATPRNGSTSIKYLNALECFFFARFNIIHSEIKPCKLLQRSA
jgi:hypothetical protein